MQRIAYELAEREEKQKERAPGTRMAVHILKWSRLAMATAAAEEEKNTHTDPCFMMQVAYAV